jgi:hypothetical protein
MMPGTSMKTPPTRSQTEPDSFRQWLVAPTTTAGAIMGGTLGALTGNLLGTTVGMILGAIAASAIERFVADRSKANSNGKTPAS